MTDVIDHAHRSTLNVTNSFHQGQGKDRSKLYCIVENDFPATVYHLEMKTTPDFMIAFDNINIYSSSHDIKFPI